MALRDIPITHHEHPAIDLLHPNGKCSCGGEGRCDWCVASNASIAELEKQDAARREKLSAQGISKVDSNLAQAKDAVLVQPWVWLPLVMLGLTVLVLAIRGDLPDDDEDEDRAEFEGDAAERAHGILDLLAYW